MMTFAATCAKAEVFEKFLSDKKETALMHGPTFMANPLGCAAANASLDLFETEPRLAQVEKIEQLLVENLSPLKSHAAVKDVRVKGAIGVVQLNNSSPELIASLRQKFLDNGALIRPFGDVIYLAPPFVISEAELKFLCDKIKEVI
jgi:adenosylmethionine-8-amino-7-oxononanoate aminotransferase